MSSLRSAFSHLSWDMCTLSARAGAVVAGGDGAVRVARGAVADGPVRAGADNVDVALVHNHSVCSGDSSVCQLISFAMSPSLGTKSGRRKGASAGLSLPGAYESLKLNSDSSNDHLACLQLSRCNLIKYSRFL